MSEKGVKEFTFKKIGLGRYAKAIRLFDIVREDLLKIYDEKGMVRAGVPMEVFDPAYEELKASWRALVETVIVDPDGLSDFDEISVAAISKVQEGFTGAAAGMTQESNAA